MRALGGDFISLISWYKLNGDLLDSSGNNNHGVSTYGNPVYVDGIVGKCLSFDGVDDCLNLPGNPKLNTDRWTISMWVNTNSKTTGRYLLTPQSDGHDMHITINSVLGLTLAEAADLNGRIYSAEGLSYDSWNHITIVLEDTAISLYINGVARNRTIDIWKKAKWSAPLKVGTRGSGTPEYYKGLISDVRIYDHCLSDKEIYELAKAKILHYDFEDVEEPTVNLFPVNIRFMPIYSGTDSSWELYKDSYDNIIYKFNRVNQALYEYNGFDTSVIVGDKYTLSLDVYVSTDYDRTGGILVRFEKAISSTFELDNSKKGMWQKAIITGVCSTTILRTLLYPSPETTSGTKGYILYRNPQLENKDHATPFVNGTRDQIIVRDKSDYGNDSLPLTLANTPAFVEDCKIGMQSVQYPNKKYVETSNVFNFNNTKTISFWFKSPVLTNPKKGTYLLSNPNGTAYIFLGSPSGIPAESNISFSVLFGKTATTYDFDMRIIKGKEFFTDNIWHNACIIFDGMDNRIYIDGTKEDVTFVMGSNTTINSSFFDNIHIGEPTNSEVGYEPNNQVILDDLRIYATALTLEDIKEIYQSRANLDDKGNLSVVSLNQQGVTSISLTEKGIYNTVEISEVGVTEGLIAWYPLNGDANDYSGNGNDGVVFGAVVAAGQGQKCYSFDGVDDYIDISPCIKLLVGSSEYSISFKFFDIDSVETNQRCVIGLNTVLGGDNNKLMYFSRNSGGRTSIHTFGIDTVLTNIGKNSFTSVTLVISNNDKNVKVFTDGMLVSTATFTNSSLMLPTDKLFICQEFDAGAGSYYFKGKIQDVRIYNRALTQEEVLINYNLTKADKTAMIQAENGTTYVNKIKEV